MISGKKEMQFFGKGCCEKCTGVKQQRKRRVKEGQLQIEVPIIFVKGKYFGTPLCTMCWINKGDDKRRTLRTRGGAGGGGGGGADTRRKGLKEDFM